MLLGFLRMNPQKKIEDQESAGEGKNLMTQSREAEIIKILGREKNSNLARCFKGPYHQMFFFLVSLILVEN